MAYHAACPTLSAIENAFIQEFDLGEIVSRIQQAMDSEEDESWELQQHLIEWMGHEIDLGANLDKLEFYNEDSCRMELSYEGCVRLLRLMYVNLWSNLS